MKKNFTTKWIAALLLMIVCMQVQAQFVQASLPGANLKDDGQLLSAEYAHPGIAATEMRGGGCSNLTAEIQEFWCIDLGAGLVPSILITFNYDGDCIVETLNVVIDDGSPQALDVSELGVESGGLLLLYLVTEESTYDMTYITDDGTESDQFTYVDDGCDDDATICDCTNTEHTIGVTTWLGDTFADDGTYTWNGNNVDFNCMNWAYDCGDIAGAPDADPYAVCTGGLPPSNGCDINVQEVESGNLFFVFPNPAAQHLTLANTSSASKLDVRIFDTAGKLVWMRNINSTPGMSHDLGFELASGTYNLEVSTGTEIQRTRLVIQ